jgi:hypothetical protein
MGGMTGNSGSGPVDQAATTKIEVRLNIAIVANAYNYAFTVKTTASVCHIGL